MDPNVVINRLVRLAKLDTTVFDEVRDDANELIPALVITVVSALLAGLGALLFWSVVASGTPDRVFVNQVIFGSIFMAVMYGVAALVVYVVMVQMFKVQVELQALVRTMGYASFPLAACILMFIPILWPVFAIVPLALLLVTTIYAVQSATSAQSNQVVIASLIGFAVFVLVLGVIATTSDSGKAPMGAGLFGIISDWNFG
ncbi:MAG: YIP1 family protein [Tepidiformaceae bacterium]